MNKEQLFVATTPLKAFFDSSIEASVISELADSVARYAVYEFLESAKNSGAYAALNPEQLMSEAESDLFATYQQLLEKNIPEFVAIVVAHKKNAIIKVYQEIDQALARAEAKLKKVAHSLTRRREKVQTILSLLEQSEWLAVLDYIKQE